MYIIALQGHPGENLDIYIYIYISTLCHKKMEKGYATLLYHIGSSRHGSVMNKSSGLVRGGFGIKQRQKISVPLIGVAT